ncbi:MAG: hopanoid biosynthesis-associated protein HpnK [Proteobacteria bacterium]|nr:hopanoid biosynthesis-associated protein HpnK [Pseudomonadota bacterium]
MRRVVFSADDFGLTESVNEAVERANRGGCLTQASLMVAAPAAADAVRRAKALPRLNVGLHLVLVDGDSLLGHARLPHITGPDGRFSTNQAALGVRYFFSPAARRELRTEIEAQFAAYAATGLTLHHADAHKHFLLHPTIGRMMIEVGRQYGLRRIRVPAEPPAILAACGERVGFGDRALYAWTKLLRLQARGLEVPDQVFGIKWSGHMTREKIERLLPHLPEGRTEIYTHPATRRDEALVSLMPGYDHVGEFEALLADYQI